jgi:phosphotransferase system HPr-like phosphotransfer protein
MQNDTQESQVAGFHPRKTASTTKTATKNEKRAQTVESASVLLRTVVARARSVMEAAFSEVEKDDLLKVTIVGAAALAAVSLLSARSLAIVGFSAGVGFAAANVIVDTMNARSEKTKAAL